VDTAHVRIVLRHQREAALARVEAMSSELGEIITSSIDANADDEHDPEGSTIAFERARVAALLAEAQAELAGLDRAAKRLEDGSYGICDRCGERISSERLEARPATAFCIRCADGGYSQGRSSRVT
jgi:DnaK suppressor protein